MYTIYEIPGVKIGCTKDFKRRSRDQKDKGNAIVLEEHTCVYEASNREQELQVKYGYPKDTIPYHITLAHGNKIDKAKAGRKGGSVSGIRGPGRKLTFADAEKIREYYNLGFTQRDLALKYNVSQRTIACIVNNITYRSS